MRQTSAPLVSVILPFANQRVLLQDAIDSVFAQEYFDWELILVDDGSGAASTRVALRYAREYPARVRYCEHPYHKQNGMSASRNLGIRQAKGDFIAFLDPTDVWFPEKLSCQVKTLLQLPTVTAAVEASLLWKSWMDESRGDTVVNVGVGEGVYEPPQLMYNCSPLSTDALPCLSGVMMRRTSARRLLFEEAFRGLFQEYDSRAFFCKIFLEERVYVSALCHTKCRQRPLLPGVGTKSPEEGRIFFLYWFRDYLRRFPMRYHVVERMVRRALMQYRQPYWYSLTVEWPKRMQKTVGQLGGRLVRRPYGKSG